MIQCLVSCSDGSRKRQMRLVCTCVLGSVSEIDFTCTTIAFSASTTTSNSERRSLRPRLPARRRLWPRSSRPGPASTPQQRRHVPGPPPPHRWSDKLSFNSCTSISNNISILIVRLINTQLRWTAASIGRHKRKCGTEKVHIRCTNMKNDTGTVAFFIW